jgi:hypothetical protein
VTGVSHRPRIQRRVPIQIPTSWPPTPALVVTTTELLSGIDGREAIGLSSEHPLDSDRTRS